MTANTDSKPTESASETSALRGVQKLQRAIIDGLEDVKAQDIVVFNTAHLTSLFERVIVASGSSNRQTKALAASVRDAVKDAGFQKPRIEGEDNGEWIVVDCGAAVAHIMQPTIRAYYHLEEIWGEKPVRVKFGATKPAVPAPAEKPKAKGDTSYAGKAPGAAKAAEQAAKQAADRAKAATRRAPAKRSPAGASAGSALKSAAKTAVKTVAKTAAKTAAKKTAASKSAAKPAQARGAAVPAKTSRKKPAPGAA
ncbi:MAG: ribosome silencing factor [Burkholderiaceae bacterium]